MKANPSKRFGKPEEVAAAVAYLLADESAYVVGQELFVDGGVTQL
jgi:3-oxoacyl-[acyl-carrier protein] reductase